MARLIEIQNVQSLPAEIILHVGDLLLVKVSGGQVISETKAIKIIGPFIDSLLLDDGEIISPMGAPNTIMLFARQPGQAQLEIIVGDPWFGPKIKKLEIVVKS